MSFYSPPLRKEEKKQNVTYFSRLPSASTTTTNKSVASKVVKLTLSYVFDRYFTFFFILKLFPTTLTLENAIAPAAIIGLNSPNAANGSAATL